MEHGVLMNHYESIKTNVTLKYIYEQLCEVFHSSAFLHPQTNLPCEETVLAFLISWLSLNEDIAPLSCETSHANIVQSQVLFTLS